VKIPFDFEPMLLFGALACMLLAGTLLRARLSFFQRFLIPSCLIGGALGLALIEAGALGIMKSDLETLAYHLFNISFISVGLTPDENVAARSAASVKGPVWMALVQSAVFALQAFIGAAAVLIFAAFGIDLFPTFGFFAPLGFEEGPGQALSIGKVWEGLGFEHAATIGLTFAALGFLFCFFIGVPLVNRGIRSGKAACGPTALPRELLTGVVSRGQPKEGAGLLSFYAGNVESLAIQSALIGLVYLLTYGALYAVGRLLPADTASMLWGFFFIFGLGLALLLRRLMRLLGCEHVLDPGLQRRLTGWAVDFLIVATIMSIQLAVVWAYAVPIGIIALAAGALTTVVVVQLGRRLDAFHLERTAAVFGTVTGTVSTGLILLRIADPGFKTPVAIELALMNVFSIPTIGLFLVVINAPLWWGWGVAATAAVFLLLAAAVLGVIPLLRMRAGSRATPPAA
jgi:ESS family glutamate:Na+ symporter